MRYKALFFLFCFTLSLPHLSWAEEDLKIAAASSLRPPLEEIIKTFQQAYPVTIKATYGASGALFAQLIHGAPFDLFLPADETLAQRLIGAGLANASFDLGEGRLVVWAPYFSDIKKEGINGLLRPAIRKIAVANPVHAPYGKAAIAALRHFGIYEKISSKLIFGEDILQATHYVHSGAADAGIVAYAMAPQEGWLIPKTAHPPVKYAGVILKKSSQQEAAQTWVQFITGEKGKAILQSWMGP
jgi:molybdate transport system substrate-binding protein